MSKSSIPPLCLKSTKKHHAIDGNLTSRVRSLRDTLAKINPVCMEIGVTRICDITYLDRLYVPNFCSVLPGTEDSIWVYSGKGPTKLHAKVSALMESIERYCSLSSTWSTKVLFQELIVIYLKNTKYFTRMKSWNQLNPFTVIKNPLLISYLVLIS